jgi:hypothetical protein
MRRAPDPSVPRCEHGYDRDLAHRDCPRCADRPVVPRAADWWRPQTRWHGTDTTLGPRTKVAITVGLIVPWLLMAYKVTLAGSQPVYAFLVVPLAGLTLVAVRLLPEVWEPGRLRPHDAGVGAETSQVTRSSTATSRSVASSPGEPYHHE